MILPFFRRALLSGAGVLLLAGCGGDDSSDGTRAPATQAAAPAADSAASPASPAVAADTSRAAAPAAPAPSAAAQDRPIGDTAALEEALAAPVRGPVNVQTVGNYQLTMDGVRKLVRVGQSLAELQARRPELADSARLGGFDPNAMYEKINGIPEVRDAVTRAGMSPREYSVAMAALFQAVMVYQMRERGVSMPQQVPVNEANVEFVEEHLDEIQQVARSAMEQMRPRP
ncbi:MAG TPA: hypothetical protein VF142_07855 [Longimicrobium sp.]